MKKAAAVVFLFLAVMMLQLAPVLSGAEEAVTPKCHKAAEAAQCKKIAEKTLPCPHKTAGTCPNHAAKTCCKKAAGETCEKCANGEKCENCPKHAAATTGTTCPKHAATAVKGACCKKAAAQMIGQEESTVQKD